MLFAVTAFYLLAAGCRRAAPPSFAPLAPLVNVTPAVSRDVPVYLDEIGQGTAFNVHHDHAAGLRDAPGAKFRGRRRREEGPVALHN